MGNILEVIFPTGAFGAVDGEPSLDAGLRALARAASADPEGEWAEKYGTAFENDEFLMHPYCWCEQDDCLWCLAGCSTEWPDRVHYWGCYQRRLGDLRQKHGKWTEGYWSGGYWRVPYGTKAEKAYNRERDALCAELEVDPKLGCEVHCTCPASLEWKALYDACQCDWHLGKGRFRFGKAVDAPHFWHKPSGFQVRWYKYIGRDIETRGEPPSDMFARCLASLATK